MENINNEQIQDSQESNVSKGKKGSLKSNIISLIVVFILVLIMDMFILLFLNKIGVVNINEKIVNIPFMSIFINENAYIKDDKDIINELNAKIDELNKVIESKDVQINRVSREKESVEKELQTTIESNTKKEEQESEELKVAQYYSQMKPKQAALIFDTLEPNIAVSIFKNMQESSVASIMQYMNPEQAAKITKEFQTFKEVEKN